MPHLVIISETGFLHSACLLDYSPARREWYGFHPKRSRRPAGLGEVDRTDRTRFINHYIRFQVSAGLLDDAASMIQSKYEGATYVVGVKDCVSLSADVAYECGLRVPYVNFTPYGLVKILQLYNTPTHVDVRPLPW